MTTRYILPLCIIAIIACFVTYSGNWRVKQTSELVNIAFINATIELSVDGNITPLNVEIAASKPAWHQGMMHRDQWGQIEGMLFAFTEEKVTAFWMKNTELPLDIVFFDAAGNVANIVQRTTPYSEALIPSLLPTQFVLELPAGDVGRRGINNATTLRLAPIYEAIGK